MADEADRADAQTAALVSAGLRNAKNNMVGKTGPSECTKCGEWNDRARQGYVTCTDCYEEALEA